MKKWEPKLIGEGSKVSILSKEEIKIRLLRCATFGESHVDNLWSETVKYIEELENARLQIKKDDG